MARKMIQKNLINNAIQAYFAAIEIHNKPRIDYRYETTSILIINAWELLLKAFVRKNIKNKSIFKSKDKNNPKQEKETLPLRTIISYCTEYLNSVDKNNYFKATAENIKLIEEYRDNSIHYYNEKFEPIIFSLIAKSAYDFVRFLKDYFDKDIIDDERMYILPIGFKLPFDPVAYFNNKYAETIESEECKKFINSTVSCIEKLKEEGIEDSIVVGFNIKVDSVKNVKNSDFLVSINNVNGTPIDVIKKRVVALSNDKGAQPVYVSPDNFYQIYPHSYRDVMKKFKEENPDLVAGNIFKTAMKKAKKNPVYAGTLGRHPGSKSKSDPQYSYSPKIFEFLKKEYKLK